SSTSATTGDIPAFGWSGYAERVNGRFAMVGFAALLLIEAISGDTFLHWAGLVP
ncbi:high light inducible protein, partial [Cyanobium sp. BA20m-p-22]